MDDEDCCCAGCFCFGGKRSGYQSLKDKEITEKIKNDSIRKSNEVKLLLLGTGDSGKSTFLRQMRVLHMDGFSQIDTNRFRTVLQESCLVSMQNLLSCDVVRVPKHLKSSRDAVIEATHLSSCAKDIVALWSDETIRDAFDRRSELQISNLPSNADYYFLHAERFASEQFVPTEDDIFRVKIKTTGINELIFVVNQVQFSLVDVGGQRAERRKWLHCFDNVTSVIFLAALDEYDMKLEEDFSTNRLEESVKLFQQVTSSQYFNPTSWILFLNKSDLFEAKIKKAPLNLFFDDISEQDAQSFEASCKYIQRLYESNFNGSRLYPYITCAVSTSSCKRVFNAVRDTVITQALSTVGFF